MTDDIPIIRPKSEPFTREYVQRTLELIGMQTICRPERDNALLDFAVNAEQRRHLDSIPSLHELREALEYLSSDAFQVQALPRKVLHGSSDARFLEGVERLLEGPSRVIAAVQTYVKQERSKILNQDAGFQDIELKDANEYFTTVRASVDRLLEAIHFHMEKGEVGLGKLPENEALVATRFVKKENTSEVHLFALHALLSNDESFHELKEDADKAVPGAGNALNKLREELFLYAKTARSAEQAVAACAECAETINQVGQAFTDQKHPDAMLIGILQHNVNSAVSSRGQGKNS